MVVEDVKESIVDDTRQLAVLDECNFVNFSLDALR